MENDFIILFDGYCRVCSRSVDFVIHRDKKKRFMFAPSESIAGKKLIQQYGLNDVDSVILIHNGTAYRYSTAVIMISRYMPFPYNLLYAFIIIPAFLRDPVYKLVASHRYKWFGKRSTCRLPEKEEEKRFL